NKLIMQDCPNGRLTPAKFVDMYKMFFPSGNAEEFCDHVFRTFDMDKNGYIDFKTNNRPISPPDFHPCVTAVFTPKTSGTHFRYCLRRIQDHGAHNYPKICVFDNRCKKDIPKIYSRFTTLLYNFEVIRNEIYKTHS
ncbi:hypothetical protein L9F63_011926, partial [Diploptera punctata]